MLKSLGCGLDDAHFKSWREQKAFLFLKMPTPALSTTHPHIQWVQDLFFENKSSGAWR
jgi:hypothetical protein